MIPALLIPLTSVQARIGPVEIYLVFLWPGLLGETANQPQVAGELGGAAGIVNVSCGRFALYSDRY